MQSIAKSNCSNNNKIFNNYDKKLTNLLINFTFSFNKFIFKILYWLSYNWKISKLLITSYLLSLFDYYFLKTNLKKVNIGIL